MLEVLSNYLGDDGERIRIRELQAGSPEAFDRLIAEYAPVVYRLAYRMLKDPADASDTVQEVFLKVFRSIGQFRGHCSLKAWIYRVTLTTASNQNRWWRRHRGQESPLEVSENGFSQNWTVLDDAPNPYESLLTRETQALVWTALLRLGESSRTVLILREMEGLPYEEMAEILHVSLGTVKSRLARARQSLREELQAIMEPVPSGLPAWSPAE